MTAALFAARSGRQVTLIDGNPMVGRKLLVTGAGRAAYRFVAANGDEVFVDFVFTAIPTSATVFVVTGVWQVTGGTGRLAGAVGSGTYDGGVEFTDADSAKGHFAMQGTISSPGSLK